MKHINEKNINKIEFITTALFAALSLSSVVIKCVEKTIKCCINQPANPQSIITKNGAAKIFWLPINKKASITHITPLTKIIQGSLSFIIKFINGLIFLKSISAIAIVCEITNIEKKGLV